MTLADATAVQQVDSHTYSANFQDGWTIGTVPHGGYVTATFQQVVRKHFETTLRKQQQPHTITLHLDFLRRTQLGPATFKVVDKKLGRQTSILHVTLTQEDREEVVGYITNSNIEKEDGASFPTGWNITPHRHPKGQHEFSIVDMWTCLKEPSSRFTNESLGFVADMFPQIIENHTLGFDCYSVEFERQNSKEEQKKLMKGKATMWYPTLLLNLDVKKALPAEGVKFLFVRVQSKMIKNGRYDLEIIIKDAGGDLVALSHHVVLAVSAERNTAARRKVDSGSAEAKL
ncbi:hypothetical protein BTJ68_14965 [Hortaea werneckii EXF-2000]|uniref:Thioesterase domain-containing protein n=1 Tax=Hortaea werneckii EXF-2000 TaxID=1157616 RepID=A0A1Z5SMK4_HORWE|nr:hypothetical protein BTJ68_14965 [Hortaea werneckii EXF-2000]